MGSIPVRVTKKRKQDKSPAFSFLRLRRNRPTRALQIKHFIALICLFCNSSPARIWVRNIAPSFLLRLGHRTALVLLTPFTTVLPLRYPVGSLSDGANSRTGPFFLSLVDPYALEHTCAFLYVQICRNCCCARGSYTSPRSARGIAVARRYTKRLVQTLKLVPH